MEQEFIHEEAVLRVGEVCEVSGRTISILVEKTLAIFFSVEKYLRTYPLADLSKSRKDS